MQKMLKLIFGIVLGAGLFVSQNSLCPAQNGKLQSVKKDKETSVVTSVAAAKKSAGSSPALAEMESRILDEINSLRRDPADYAAHLESIKPHYDGNMLKKPGQTTIVTNEGTAALDEAILFLKEAKPASPVQIAHGLHKAADMHLQDLLQSGKTGHVGSDGSTPENRLETHGEWNGEMKELISYHALTPREVVLNYLIDDGNKRRGHRLALLKNNLSLIGIKTGDSNKHGKLCVIVMAEEFSGHPAKTN